MQIWTPNQSLQNGRFIVQKVLGGGGYGITYSAIEQPTGKLFVIKTLNHIQQSKADFDSQQVKFVNEALRLAQCSHPHIVKVNEVIKEGELWGMVMEYIDGQDLAKYIDERGQLSESEALQYINQIGKALEYVHAKGFLHRDIKPNNILLRRDTQEAVLIDFGLTREFQGGKTGSMTNARTEGYAPIEQYERRGTFGAYTDVYALAGTLYSLLTAEVPLPANFRKTGIPLHPPQQFNSGISDRVNEAILKGMGLLVEERPQTVGEWLELVNPKLEVDSLKSAVRMDYTRLRDLLAAGELRKADNETARVMLAVAGKKKQGWLGVEDIDNFPCEDLRTIDQLWVKYSNGRFGFSVQKRIYQSLGGTREYNDKIWYAFCDAVGWRKDGEWMYYKDLTFDLTAPVAHLPGGMFDGFLGVVGGVVRGGGLVLVVCGSLLSRRDL
ncbi:GUN4 domain-containing protein [Calothrix sp. FACHB-1219]|uniref:serine/threonine-protein kinase n=1 Tax=unclassified Calothrix TaxID=2619626 RepID=UPI001681EF94|nr:MULTISPECIES: serine/threonine-protein kinase [unclassified Calothrix]MBD2206578.1 GUN4 domain-containing protein [Calothrix sp. FACHB-168]MBD2221373.1 GUN4 domain-containing protein [Calothrix sp. FACHB-1219]